MTSLMRGRFIFPAVQLSQNNSFHAERKPETNQTANVLAIGGCFTRRIDAFWLTMRHPSDLIG